MQFLRPTAIDWRRESPYRPEYGRKRAAVGDGQVPIVQTQMSFLPLVRVWLWGSVLASVAGWLLSALGLLNGAGYAAFCVVGVFGLWFGRKALGGLASP